MQSKTQPVAEDCPLFTSRHAHHSAAWSIEGFSLPLFCVACATERLEGKGELSVHVRKVLSEFQALLNTSGGEGGGCRLTEVLCGEQRVLEHLCGLLFGLLSSPDASTAQMSLDVLLLFLGHTETPDLTRKLMERAIHTVTTSHNFQTSLPLLLFLGKLVQSNDHLSLEVAKSFGGFLEFLIGGLTYPDESVKSKVVFILIQVCSKAPPNSIPIPLVQNICKHISTNLATAKSHDLTVNLLDFVRHLLKSGAYAQCLVQADRLKSDAKGSTLASAFKRVLLSRDEQIQLSGVLCVTEILAHQVDYGKILLKADIAEFMFEALSSKNELLMSALFSCLNSLAGLEDFYSKSHTVYGIDPVMTGLSTALRLKNYDATQHGFNLLSRMLSRQPCGMPLLTGEKALPTLLSLTNAALQVPSPDVVLHATLALANLLSIHHIPPTFPLNTFLPLLALLLHQIELLMPQDDPVGAGGCASQPTTGPPPGGTKLSPAMRKQMYASYITMDKMNRLVLECSKQPQHKSLVTEEVVMFLSKTYEESVIPPLLFYIDELYRPEPFISTLSIALCQFVFSPEGEAYKLAKKVALAGFIQLTFDLRMKFCSINSYRAFLECINQFLVHLCLHLEHENKERAGYVRDVLQTALPHMDCSGVDCLQFLSQRTAGVGNLLTLQSAVLALFFYATTHVQDEQMSLAPKEDLQKALSTFLSLNHNVHLLPPTTLTHLTVIYVQVFSDQVYRQTTQILLRGLQIIPNPETIFAPQPALLKWAFLQEPLIRSGLARKWLIQWLKMLTDESCNAIAFLNMLHSSPSLLTHLLDILASGSFDEPSSLLSLLESLVSKSSEHRQVASQHLQSILITNHLEPEALSDTAMTSILRVLATVQKSSGEQLNIKVIYKLANLLTRVDMDTDDAGDANTSPQLTQLAVELLTGSLTQPGVEGHSQVPMLLLSNTELIHRVALLSSPTQGHTILSASALQLAVELMCCQFQMNIKVSTVTKQFELSKSSVISALTSHLVSAQVAGLEFWTVVFKHDGQTGCFTLKHLHSDKRGRSPSQWDCVKVVLFLVQNLLIKDIKSVSEKARLCFLEILKYLSERTPSDSPFEKSHFWHTSIIDYMTDIYHCSTFPLCQLPCLNAMLELVSPATSLSSVKQNRLGQLLYKTLMSYLDSETDQSQKTNLYFKTCFKKLQNSIPSSLSDTQWNFIAEKLEFLCPTK